MKITAKKLLFCLIGLIIIGALLVVTIWYKNLPSSKTTSNTQKKTQINTPTSPTKTPLIAEPIINAKTRITKKPYGVYITPVNSPVQPERFSGYHTGTDFEVTNQELTQNIAIFAVCDGKILIRQWVSGYGGVIVQSCLVKNEAVTVLYGHLNISESDTPVAGDNVKAGEHLAILGTPYSPDTDGERKHLHLAIHKGMAIDYRGYVQNETALSNWVDAKTLL
jgi:murein DD-endopeptidase MepM/ murein hydrolase activator NlpD